jgi:outer membrane protease
MKVPVVWVASLLFVLSSCGNKVSGVDLRTGIGSQMMIGHTTYHIKFITFNQEMESDVKSDSELEFPLDVFMLTGNVGLEGKLKGGKHWGVKLAVSKNINHPGGYMKDSDWISIPKDNINAKFSYTESDAQLNALLICLEGHLGLVRKARLNIDLVGGYEYQNFSFEILGIRGWQGFNLSERIYFDAYQDTNVLDYDITYKIPYLGTAIRYQAIPQLNWEALLAVSPHTQVRDHDDHLLRFKTADSECSGWALKVGTDIRWNLFGTPTSSNWSFTFGFYYTQISTKGSQAQTWYGDDPASPDFDDTGGKAAGINQKITSNQMAIRAMIDYGF